MPFHSRGASVREPRRLITVTGVACLLMLPLVLLSTGCGSGGGSVSTPPKTTPTTNTIGLSANPSQVTLLADSTQTFVASVNGTTNQNVTWSVYEGPAGGSITAGGVYTAPSGAGTYHVLATSVAEPTQAAEATVTVVASPTPTANIAVAISPLSLSLSVGATETFFATVTNSTNTGVTYSVEEGAAGGTITTGGVYTAPPTAGTYHVFVTSVADTAVSAMAIVTVVPTVTVTPLAATLAINGSTTFSATVNGISDQSVSYTIVEGSAGGAITSAGVYMAPTTAGTYHIVATSTADPSISGTASVTVQSGNSALIVH